MRVCLFVALAAVVSHAGAIALRANSTATDSADDTDEPNDPASKQIAAFPSQVRLFNTVHCLSIPLADRL